MSTNFETRELSECEREIILAKQKIEFNHASQYFDSEWREMDRDELRQYVRDTIINQLTEYEREELKRDKRIVMQNIRAAYDDS